MINTKEAAKILGVSVVAFKKAAKDAILIGVKGRFGVTYWTSEHIDRIKSKLAS